MKFPMTLESVSRKWLVIPPVAVGFVVVALAIWTKEGPQQVEIDEIAYPQRVAVVSSEQVQPTAIGYGVARPARVWRAIARVDGEVVAVHPNLDAGRRVEAGEMLLQIDRTDYELSVERLASEAVSLMAQIREAERRGKNDRAIQKIEEASLELLKTDLARQRRLADRGAVSKSAVEQAERSMLRQAQVVQALRNSLALLPSQLERLKASLEAAEKQLAQTRRDLARTTVKAPFDARVAAVSIEEGQYVGPNEPLFELHGSDTYEVEVRTSLDDAERLTVAADEHSGDLGEQLRGLRAEAQVSSGDWSRTWDGEVVRVRELVDQRTRTLGLVIAVTKPQRGGTSLLEGTFTQVRIFGQERDDQLVVPLAAVRNGSLFVVDDEDRLRRRSVEIDYRLDERLVLSSGVRPGDRVVVGDPTPSADGTLIKPIRESDGNTDQVADDSTSDGDQPLEVGSAIAMSDGPGSQGGDQ